MAQKLFPFEKPTFNMSLSGATKSTFCKRLRQEVRRPEDINGFRDLCKNMLLHSCCADFAPSGNQSGQHLQDVLMMWPGNSSKKEVKRGEQGKLLARS